MKTSVPCFSKKTLEFLTRASRQKNPTWLDKNREEYEETLLQPLQHLASTLKAALSSKAPGYHFPQKGIGRLKRPSNRVEKGGALYKNWLVYSASRPAESRFERNPSLVFVLEPSEGKDSVLVAGGLYMPSSRQVRAIREAIAVDASAFEALFRSKAFSHCFPEGFSDERVSTRVPRGFDASHPHIDWIKLQAFFVWRSYSVREFSSPRFAKQMVIDCTQILRLNEFLDRAVAGRLHSGDRLAKDQPDPFLERLQEIKKPRQQMDF
ncbi:DUF2461 family protein [Bdellovibrionota bacterium FG-1]